MVAWTPISTRDLIPPVRGQSVVGTVFLQNCLRTITLVIAVGGCASVTRGVDETVTFDSVPAGATMRSVFDTHCGACMVDSPVTPTTADEPPPVPGPACITPCSVTVPRNKALIATFTKDGYQPETINIRWKVPPTGAAGFAGNALLGGVVGIAIDAGTGAALDHTPNPAVAVLRPIGKPPLPEASKKKPKSAMSAAQPSEPKSQ
jgi:hypothetical protein